jgi:hypothetical protein
VVSGCDSGAAADKTSSVANTSQVSPTSRTSMSTSTTPPPPGVAVGKNPSTRLKVDTWGATSDGLLSVIVSNVGDATVRSARALISAKDQFGNVVAAVTAPPGTWLGTRCCTIIGLAPGHRYGLYLDIGTRIKRVKRVDVEYSEVRTDEKPVPSPVLQMRHATLHPGAKLGTVSVTVKMAAHVGPYITVQALLNGPGGKFLGVISGGFYCLKANTQRTINLQFFHPVPAGSSVDSVISFPLDATTARLEKLRSCSAS